MILYKKLKKIINIFTNEKMIEDWIKNSKTYENKSYLDSVNVPIIDLNSNFTFKELSNFLSFWHLYKPYPIEIYIFLFGIMFKSSIAARDNLDKNTENHLRILLSKDIYYFIIVTNNIEFLIYVVDNYQINTFGLLQTAFTYNNSNMIKYLLNIMNINEHGINFYIKLAFKYNHFEIVKLLFQNDCIKSSYMDFNEYLMFAINNIDMVNYMKIIDRLHVRNEHIEHVCTFGNIEILKILMTNYRIDHKVIFVQYIYTAISKGYIDIVKYLCNFCNKDDFFGFFDNQKIMTDAIKSYKNDCIIYMFENKYVNYNYDKLYSIYNKACNFQNIELQLYINNLIINLE